MRLDRKLPGRGLDPAGQPHPPDLARHRSHVVPASNMLDHRVRMDKVDRLVGEIGEVPGIADPGGEEVAREAGRDISRKFGLADIDQVDVGDRADPDIAPVVGSAADIEHDDVPAEMLG
jgi:hypothetical protein